MTKSELIERLKELVQEWRADGEKYWSPVNGYPSPYMVSQSHTLNHCADQLEKVIKSEPVPDLHSRCYGCGKCYIAEDGKVHTRSFCQECQAKGEIGEGD